MNGPHMAFHGPSPQENAFLRIPEPHAHAPTMAFGPPHTETEVIRTEEPQPHEPQPHVGATASIV